MKKTKQSVNKVKNAVRGTFNKPKSHYLELTNHYGAPKRSPSDLILGGLAELNRAEAEAFFSWLSGFPAKMASIFPRNPIRSIKEIKFSTIKSDMDLNLRLRYLCKFLVEYKVQIKEFNESRYIFENFILDAQYDAALKQLDLIELRHGLSLWAIELRIALLQVSKGLEAQKEYVTSLTSESHRSAAAVIAAWISQRNEEGTIYNRFKSRLKTNMSRWKIHPNTINAYAYLLGIESFNTLSENQASNVLASVSSLSLIDAYVTVRDALASYPERYNEIPESSVTSYMDVAGDSDVLAMRLSAMHPGNIGAIQKYTSLTHQDDILSNLLDVAHGVRPKEFSSSTPSGANLLNEIGRLIDLSVSRKSGFAVAIDTGLKRLANFRHLDIARAASAVIAMNSNHAEIFKISKATPFLLFSRNISPWHAIVVPKALGLRIVDTAAPSTAGKIIRSALVDKLSEENVSALAYELSARNEIQLGNLEKALDVLGRAPRTSISIKRIGPLQVTALLRQQRLSEAVTVAADLVAIDDTASSVLSISELVEEIKLSNYQVDDKLSLALILNAYLDEKDDREIFQQLQFAYEDALAGFGVERPSDLRKIHNKSNDKKIIEFMRRVAVPAVMDVSFWLFKNSRDTLSERISVCSALTTLDADNRGEYNDEIKEITRVIDIEKGIEDVDKSRVFVDLPRLARWANQELRESFDRYKALTRAGVGFENPDEFERLVRDFVSGKDVSNQTIAQYPKDEAGQLLIEIIDAVVHRYFNDEDFGLDAYLSMRVRHGSLAGHLRGPFEEANLLVARDKATGRFPDIPEWSDIQSEIHNFSTAYEGLIDELTKHKLQIRSVSQPKGLFFFELQLLSVYYVRSRIDESTNLEDLLDLIYETLEIYLANSLQQVRSYIANDFRERAEQALTAFSNAADATLVGDRRAKLRNAFAAVSPDWQASVDRVASWFALSQENERAALRTMEQIVNIAIQATKNAHRAFDPVLKLDIEDLGPQSASVLVQLTDILFTILDNVYRHSKVDGQPWVSIELRMNHSDGDVIDKVVLVVTNQIGVDARSLGDQKRIVRIREQIASGDYKSRVKLEGGTGFLKLKRIIAPDNRQTLEFGFIEEGFRVEIGMVLIFYPEGARLGGLA